MQVVSMFFVASFHSGFQQGIVCCFFFAWAHTSLWSSSGLSRECLGCFGDVLGRLLGCFGDALGRLLGASKASWEAFGASGASGDASGCFGGASGRLLGASRASQRGSWELPGRPGERPGVLLGRLGKHFRAPRELWERKRRKSENHRFT